MARNKWRGDALAVAQISQVTITAAGSAGDTVSITINRKTITYTIQTGDTTVTAATGLLNLLTASTIVEFLKVSWSKSTATIIGTAATAGVPFVFTAAATGGATVGGVSTPTVSSGPNHWDTAANWSLNAIPVSTNDVDIEDNAVDILWGINQSGVTLASLNISSTYTGKIGNTTVNPSGYVEYLDTYLAIGATTCTIGYGQGSGSSRIKVDFGTVQTTLIVYGTATGGLSGLPALFVKGTNASNTATIVSGAVGLAFDIATSFVCTTLSIGGNESSGGIGPNVQVGAAATLTNVNIQGGKILFLPGTATLAITTLAQDGGEITANGALTVTTHNCRGGRFYWDGSGTVTTLAVVGGYWDASRDPRAKVVTNSTVYARSTIRDPAKHVTFTNPISFPDGLSDVTQDLGKQITLLRA